MLLVDTEIVINAVLKISGDRKKERIFSQSVNVESTNGF